MFVLTWLGLVWLFRNDFYQNKTIVFQDVRFQESELINEKTCETRARTNNATNNKTETNIESTWKPDITNITKVVRNISEN